MRRYAFNLFPMKNKLFLAIMVLISFLASRCGSNNESNNAPISTAATPKHDTVVMSLGLNSKGIGRFKNVVLTHPLDAGMVAKGQAIYSAKCISCHKLTDEKLVGPGWKGVTDRQKPEWIMNFITNTSVMLDSDMVAQSLIAICLVRMPSQNLTDDQARDMLEFMRKNDGKN